MHLDQNAVLLLIDVQQGFQDPSLGSRNNPSAEEKIGALLQRWRWSGRPVVHVQHFSRSESSVFHPSKPGVQLQVFARPQGKEPLFIKDTNSAFIGTRLEDFLRERGYETLVVVGLTTDHCVSTTVRMAANLNFAVYIVEDATATFERVDHTGRRFFAEKVHRVTLATLHGEFAAVATTAEVLEMLSQLKSE